MRAHEVAQSRKEKQRSVGESRVGMQSHQGFRCGMRSKVATFSSLLCTSLTDSLKAGMLLRSAASADRACVATGEFRTAEAGPTTDPHAMHAVKARHAALRPIATTIGSASPPEPPTRFTKYKHLNSIVNRPIN